MIALLSWSAGILPAARRHLVGNLPVRCRERFCTLVSSVRQHSFHSFLIAVGNERVYVQQPLSLICLLGQNMAGGGMASPVLATGSQKKERGLARFGVP